MAGLLTLLRSIQKLASRRVTGWNGREFFALRHSSKVRFHRVDFNKKLTLPDLINYWKK